MKLLRLSLFALIALFPTAASANMWGYSIALMGLVAIWWMFVLPLIFEWFLLKWFLRLYWSSAFKLVLMANLASSVVGLVLSGVFADTLGSWFDRAVGFKYIWAESVSWQVEVLFFAVLAISTTGVNWAVETPILAYSKDIENSQRKRVALGVLLANLGSFALMFGLLFFVDIIRPQ
ncbi:hypothetical protein [Aliiroseovarius sp. S253]|uniref:hypothetical protein n=1 Tax=Aliiroseovarius sp. S253 TaxID=3415133 RepID=UPI003C7C5C02